jgi:hypothetical protein
MIPLRERAVMRAMFLFLFGSVWWDLHAELGRLLVLDHLLEDVVY